MIISSFIALALFLTSGTSSEKSRLHLIHKALIALPLCAIIEAHISIITLALLAEIERGTPLEGILLVINMITQFPISILIFTDMMPIITQQYAGHYANIALKIGNLSFEIGEGIIPLDLTLFQERMIMGQFALPWLILFNLASAILIFSTTYALRELFHRKKWLLPTSKG